MEHEEKKFFGYPSHDVEIFVKWYKNIMKFVNSEEHSKVIKIDFENFSPIEVSQSCVRS